MCLKSVFLVALVATFFPGFVHAQYLGYAFHANAKKGEQLYHEAGCKSCHGPDGRGTPKVIAGFEPPRTFPDFSKCDQTTPEVNSCLLYTSPSPRDTERSRMPSSA